MSGCLGWDGIRGGWESMVVPMWGKVEHGLPQRRMILPFGRQPNKGSR